MANDTFVRFKTGSTQSIDSTPKEAGQVLFAIRPDNKEGVIYYDKSNSIRVKMAPDHVSTADSLAIERSIDGVPFDGSSDISHYGTCTTAAGTAAKVAQLIGPFYIDTGALVFIKFTYTNSVANPTLNVNNSGAFPIRRYGTTSVSTNAATSWQAGSVVGFMFDGTAWQMIGWLNNNDNTIPSIYCTTAADTAAKVGACTDYNLLNNSYSLITLKTANTKAGALTLNVNGKGAKPIYINGNPSSNTNYTLPAGQYLIYYDGTNYQFRTDGIIPGTVLATVKDESGNLITDYLYSASINGKILTFNNGNNDVKHTLTIGLATQAELLKPIKTTTTASASTWNIPTGAVQVWGERFRDSSLTYTPSGGSATEVTDTGDWTMWLAGDGTTNKATLNMRIDGDFYATTFRGAVVGNVSGNATTANTWKTARNFTIVDSDSTNNGVSVSVDGSKNIQLPLPENIKVNTLLATSINIKDGDINFVNIKDKDRYINFFYEDIGATKSGASWRIGYKGTGSNDANYFIIQSGTSTTSATTWNDVVRLGMNSYDASFAGNVNPIVNNSKTLGTSSLKWKAVYATDFYGNATTATTWKTARNFTIVDADQTNSGVSTSVNGSGNVTLYLPENIKVQNLLATSNITINSGNLDIVTGNTDKFINWYYNTNKVAGASWRMGVLGTGSGNANYLIIQSGKDPESGTTWNNVARFEMNTFDVSFSSTVKPFTNNTQNLGTSSLKWANVYATNFVGNASTADAWKTARNFVIVDADQTNSGVTTSVNGGSNVTLYMPENIKVGTLTSTAGIILTGGKLTLNNSPIHQSLTGTNIAATSSTTDGVTTYTPMKWTFNLNLTPATGDIISIKTPGAGHDYGVFLSTNNGTNYYPITLAGTGRLTTHYGTGSYLTLMFDSSNSAASMYPLAGGSSRVTVSGGTWRVLNYYDSGNPGDWNLRQYNVLANEAIVANNVIVRVGSGYRHLKSGQAFDITYPVLFSTAAIANNAVGSPYIHHYAVTITTTQTRPLEKSSGNYDQQKAVFIKGTLIGNEFYPISTTPLTQTLPSTDDGYAYYYIGRMYNSTTAMTFDTTARAIFVFKNGEIKQIVGYSQYSEKTKAANITTTANAVAYYSNTTGTFASKTSANGVLYATSANGTLQWGTLPPGQGGTGQTSLINASNALLNALSVGSSVPADGDYYISQYVGGGTTTTTYHRRPMSALWSYIKSKTDAVYATYQNILDEISLLDYTDTAENGKFVNKVSEANGVISVERISFNPSIAITAGTSSAAPKVNVTVNGVSGTAQAITTASTSVYGVTKLTNTLSSSVQNLAMTPKGVYDVLTTLTVTDTAESGKYVSKIDQTNGVISITRASLSPSLTITAGTSSAAPKINVTVGGVSGTAQAITIATTGVYGVTKLTSTPSTDNETMAMTPKGVQTAISNLLNDIDYTDTTESGKYVSEVDQTDGIISVTRANFSPSVSIGAGTSSATPTVKITVGGASSSAVSITKATTGIYGTTKLSSTSSKTEETLAATPKGVWAAINSLDVDDTAQNGQYVSKVAQVDGAIDVTRANFNPSVSITAGTSSAAPKVGISVGGASATAQAITIASTSIYGVTKLSSTSSSTAENVAATPKGVWAAINSLDIDDAEQNGQYVSAVSQIDGIVQVTKTNFAPSIAITAGTSTDAPKVNVTVNTKSGTAQALTKATTGLYGVTKLSSTSSTTEETLAATPKGVWAAIDTVKYKVQQIGNNENKEFPILLKNANNTTDETATVKFNKTANKDTTINPSTGMIGADSFRVAKKVKLEYNENLDTLNFVFV